MELLVELKAKKKNHTDEALLYQTRSFITIHRRISGYYHIRHDKENTSTPDVDDRRGPAGTGTIYTGSVETAREAESVPRAREAPRESVCPAGGFWSDLCARVREL